MSLSTWFREYVYIPLGGNRVRPARHILNLLVVWSLTGLWHGASWNFVIWGLYYGVLLIVEKYFLGRYLEKAPPALRHVYTMVIVMIGWVFFSSADLSAALHYLRNMFCLGGLPAVNMQTMYLLRNNLLLMAVGCVCSAPIALEQFEQLEKRRGLITNLLLMILLILSTAYLVFSSYNPFLYFRF